MTEAIRDGNMRRGASRVAALPGVRAASMERQRAFRAAARTGCRRERHGSVVFPDAMLKIYLTASAEERARRRYKQLIDKGLSANMTALLQEFVPGTRATAAAP